MELCDCISCPDVTNEGNCARHVCACSDVVKCEYWRRLTVMWAARERRLQSRRKVVR